MSDHKCGECLEYARGSKTLPTYVAANALVDNDDVPCEAIAEYVTAEMEACEGFKAKEGAA